MIKLKNIAKVNMDDISALKSETFYNRIMANYTLMNSEIEAKDLLHMVTQPSEVFLAEGDEYNIFNQNNNTINQQQKKIDVLNNLINRIVISQTEHSTYQDTVYISSMLRKLGITDTKNFMKQVSVLIQENNNTKAQLNILNQNINEYRTGKEIEALNNKKEDDQASDIQEDVASPYFLHQDIFNRLDTREIYNLISELIWNEASGTEITKNILAVTEQIRTGDQLHLQQLKNEIMGKDVPLVYSHENYYEEETLNFDNSNNEVKVTNDLSRAVLLSLVDKVYELEGAKINSNRNEWYYISNALYESTQNTIERYTQNLIGPISQEFRINQIEASINTNQMLMDSLTLLQKVNSEEEFIQYLSEINENRVDGETRFERLVESPDGRSFSRREPVQSGDRDNLTASQENDIQPATMIQNYNSEEEILQYLNEVNERNINNQIQYKQALDNFKRRAANEKKEEKPVDRDRQRRESLMALQNAPELLEIYREAENERIEPQMTESERIFLEELPADVREYMELVQQAVNISERGGNDTRANLAGLQDDIARVEMINKNSDEPSYEDDIFRADYINAQEIVDRVIDQGRVTNTARNVQTTFNEELNFVHKENETIDSEEIVERLREDKVFHLNESKVVNEVHETHTTVNKTEIKNEVINELKESSQITGMVAKSMQDQLSQISDQVYSRLERRLANEKRRRGI